MRNRVPEIFFIDYIIIRNNPKYVLINQRAFFVFPNEDAERRGPRHKDVPFVYKILAIDKPVCSIERLRGVCQVLNPNDFGAALAPIFRLESDSIDKFRKFSKRAVLHRSIPSNSFNPASISFSNSISSRRICRGGTCSTSS